MTAPNPADQYTWGTKAWAALLTAAAALEIYGLHYDRKHPGNREKWTLTSNARTWGGFDSVTGEPLEVPFGTARRSALLMSLTWVTHHWTRKKGTF